MIVIRVKLSVNSENSQAFKEVFLGAVEDNKGLEGCVDFQLYQQASEENSFLVYEEWKDMASFEQYKKSEAFSQFMMSIKPLLSKAPNSAYYQAEVVGP